MLPLPYLGLLLLVTAARDVHADAEGDVLDALLPDLLVQLGVDTNILRGGERESMNKSTKFMERLSYSDDGVHLGTQQQPRFQGVFPFRVTPS